MTDTKENGEKFKLSLATRRRMAAAQKKRFAAKKAGRVVASRRKEVSDAPLIEEGTFSYALGYVECWLQTYAAAAGVPHGTLAARVGKVLQVKARG